VSTGSWAAAYVASSKLYFNPSTGVLYATTFNSLSDATVKNSVVRINNAVDTINKLEGVEFNWNDTGNKSAGLIAQELEKVLPHLVDTAESGIKSVNYVGLIGYLIEAIKDLSNK
jgi:hypothetical protein